MDFIDEDQRSNVIQLVKARQELLERAKECIAGKDEANWMCPGCSEDTFIVTEEQCCFCHRKEQIIECPTCGTENFEHDLIDISMSFDWSIDEGLVTVQNYGMEQVCCPECVAETREKVEDIRRSQYDEDMAMAMEEYYFRKEIIPASRARRIENLWRRGVPDPDWQLKDLHFQRLICVPSRF